VVFTPRNSGLSGGQMASNGIYSLSDELSGKPTKSGKLLRRKPNTYHELNELKIN